MTPEELLKRMNEKPSAYAGRNKPMMSPSEAFLAAEMKGDLSVPGRRPQERERPAIDPGSAAMQKFLAASAPRPPVSGTGFPVTAPTAASGLDPNSPSAKAFMAATMTPDELLLRVNEKPGAPGAGQNRGNMSSIPTPMWSEGRAKFGAGESGMAKPTIDPMSAASQKFLATLKPAILNGVPAKMSAAGTRPGEELITPQQQATESARQVESARQHWSDVVDDPHRGPVARFTRTIPGQGAVSEFIPASEMTPAKAAELRHLSLIDRLAAPRAWGGFGMPGYVASDAANAFLRSELGRERNALDSRSLDQRGEQFGQEMGLRQKEFDQRRDLAEAEAKNRFDIANLPYSPAALNAARQGAFLQGVAGGRDPAVLGENFRNLDRFLPVQQGGGGGGGGGNDRDPKDPVTTANRTNIALNRIKSIVGSDGVTRGEAEDVMDYIGSLGLSLDDQTELFRRAVTPMGDQPAVITDPTGFGDAMTKAGARAAYTVSPRPAVGYGSQIPERYESGFFPQGAQMRSTVGPFGRARRLITGHGVESRYNQFTHPGGRVVDLDASELPGPISDQFRTSVEAERAKRRAEMFSPISEAMNRAFGYGS